jgi:hypothetical protein
MLDVTVAVRAIREVTEMVRGLGSFVATARQQAAEVREAKQLLGLSEPAGEAYRSDAVHPLYTPGKLHPDNEAALLAASIDLGLNHMVQRDEIHVDAADNSLLLFGSPTSEGLSRVVFDYSELPDRDGLACLDRPLDFAYAWDLDPESVGDGEVGRYVPGKGVVRRPPWQITSFRSQGPTRFVPETDSEGMITEDYLLVTRMRNFLSPAAQAQGRFLVSFGGAHGTGTRAVACLFRDKRLLRQVLEALKQKHREASGQLAGVPKAYQLLFRVSGIKHTERGSIPHHLELADAVILGDNESSWDLARRRVAPRLKRQPPPPETGGSE